MTKKIKFGFIGTGNMAYIYANIINQRYDCDICAVVGNTDKKTKEFAKNFNISGYSNSAYEKMFLNHSEIEVVIIATPEWIRLDPIISSIKFKKHILLEKPFANSLDEAKEINNLLKNYPYVFDICHVLRYSPRFFSLKKSISDGDIGDIRNIYARRNSNNERVKRVIGKTNLAFWLTPHDVDIMRWITSSEVVEVYTLSRNKISSIDDYLIANLIFENGVTATLQILWCIPPINNISRQSIFEVWGTKGYIEVEDYNMNINVYSNNNLKTHDTYEDYKLYDFNKGIFENFITSFIRRIYLKDNDNIDVLRNAYKSIEVCDLISKSIIKGESVKISN